MTVFSDRLFGYSLAPRAEAPAPDPRSIVAGLLPGKAAAESAARWVRALATGSSHAALLDLAQDEALVGHVLRGLSRRCLLRWHFGPEGASAYADLESFSALYGPIHRTPDDPAALRRPLSRFAGLRFEGTTAILENAERHARLTFAPGGLHLLAALPAPAADEDLSGEVAAFRQFLFSAGFLEPAGEEPPDRAAWAFHDLLFHDASRLFLAPHPLGRKSAASTQDAAVKRPMAEARIQLPRPDAGSAPSAPLDRVMGTRRSLRRPGAVALSLPQLSRFLWRSLRARADTTGTGEPCQRPIPAGGAVQELEFYLAIGRCEGLPAGFYHYREAEHALERLPAHPDFSARAIADAAQAMGEAAHPPDCVIILASRLPALAAAYRGIAYRLSLLHAGHALQTFYLTATDLGLAPCALGSGDSALFERLTGLPALTETALAEFALSGGAPPGT